MRLNLWSRTSGISVPPTDDLVMRGRRFEFDLGLSHGEVEIPVFGI